MHALAVLDVVARVDVAEVAKLYANVVTGDWVACQSRCNLGDDNEPLLIAILPSSTSSEERQMRTVSFLFLPRTMMVSPRKRPSVSIVAGFRVATELSSLAASSTMSLFGLVCVSERLLAVAPDGPLFRAEDGGCRVLCRLGRGQGRLRVGLNGSERRPVSRAID